MDNDKPRYRPDGYSSLPISSVEIGSWVEVFPRGNGRKSYRVQVLERIQTFQSDWGNDQFLVQLIKQKQTGLVDGISNKHLLGQGTCVRVLSEEELRRANIVNYSKV